MIALRFCKLELTSGGAVTHFPDGSTWGALPHDADHYSYLAYRYGHDGDKVAYAQAHELCHHLIAEAFSCHSAVLWALAHDEKPTPMIAAAEEALVQALHRYVMTNEPALIEGVDWAGLKARFLGLTDPRDEGDLL